MDDPRPQPDLGGMFWGQSGVHPVFMERRFPTCQSFVWLEQGEPVGVAYLLPCMIGERQDFFQGEGCVSWNVNAVEYALEEQRLMPAVLHTHTALAWTKVSFVWRQAGKSLYLRETTLPVALAERISRELCKYYGAAEIILEYPASRCKEGKPRGCCWNFNVNAPGWIGLDLA